MSSLTDKEILDFVRENLTLDKDENGSYKLKEVNCAVEGHVYGNIFGDVRGWIDGTVFGDVVGDVVGAVEGDVVGNVLGNVGGGSAYDAVQIAEKITGKTATMYLKNANR